MFRYVALLWNSQDPRQESEARRLAQTLQSSRMDMKPVLANDGVYVICANIHSDTNNVYRLSHNRGVVLGALFSQEMSDGTPPKPIALDDQISETILRSEGRHLIDHYWGRYVAFFRKSHGPGGYALHSPVGAMQCYMIEYEGIVVVFSDIEDCAATQLFRFSINWRYVSAYLLNPFVYPNATGINEITRIQQGECVETTPNRAPKRSLYWNLMQFADKPIEDAKTALTSARQMTQACVNAWAAEHPRIVLKLSGGLDSSIVLACLRDAPTKPFVTCLNYFDRSTYGDEREFFRSAASVMPIERCEIIEFENDPSRVPLESLLGVPPSPQPAFYHVSLLFRVADLEFSQARKAALFEGSYGDQLFLTETRFAAIDQAWRRRLDGSLLGTISDSARSQGQTFWASLADTLCIGLLRRPLARAADIISPFLSRDSVEALQADAKAYLKAFWQDDRHRLPPGKLSHLEYLCAPLDGFNPFERPGDPVRRMPLLSQPLVELFARLPTEMLVAGGLDRSLIRRAFAKDLPAKLLTRQTKGLPSDFFLGTFQRHKQFVHDTLLGGTLVSEGLLDRSQIERFFADSITPNDERLSLLTEHHFNLELWLNSCKQITKVARSAPSASPVLFQEILA
jgi:asparagine synthase (glutamine-hydrolysing)